MFAIHTPIKKINEAPMGSQEENTSPKSQEKRAGKSETVRKSIENIEASQATRVEAQPQKRVQVRKPNLKETTKKIDLGTSPPVKRKYPTLILEAEACLSKAKGHLAESKNMRTDIKGGLQYVVDRLYEIIVTLNKATDLTAANERDGKKGEKAVLWKEKEKNVEENKGCKDSSIGIKALAERIEEHTKLLVATSNKMDHIGSLLEGTAAVVRERTYAGVVADGTKSPPGVGALHSVVVSSSDEVDTSDQVLQKVRQVMNAKEGWIRVERVKKIKDRKVIIGCKTKDERDKVRDRLKEMPELNVEEKENKDPLFVLKDVFDYNTDEEVVKALKNQNKKVFEGIQEDMIRMKIVYRKRVRNPLQCSIVVRASPEVWKRCVEQKRMYVDLQRVEVADQSPLVQCSHCLGYGHTKKWCKEEEEKCGHCGGPHKRIECQQWSKREPPKCCNCSSAGLDNVEHSAFSMECPVRKRWDILARSIVMYC